MEMELVTRSTPENAYFEHDLGTPGQKVRIYISQPVIPFSQGEFVDMDRIRVKISDFGKGMILNNF